MAGRPNTILHDDRVDEIATGKAAPRANGVELAALDDIQWIERVDGMHETTATMTGYPIHVAASP